MGHGTVSEESHNEVAITTCPKCESGPDSDGQARRDDSVRAKDSLLRVGDMHGAPAAVARAGLAPHQLSKHATQVQALGDDVTMPAVR